MAASFSPYWRCFSASRYSSQVARCSRLPVVFRIGVSPAGGFPPVSLKVFNGEVSFAVVGDGPAFVGV